MPARCPRGISGVMLFINAAGPIRDEAPAAVVKQVKWGSKVSTALVREEAPSVLEY